MLQKEVWISWLSVFNVKITITVLKTHLGIVRMPYPLILIIALRDPLDALMSPRNISSGIILEAMSKLTLHRQGKVKIKAALQVR